MRSRSFAATAVVATVAAAAASDPYTLKNVELVGGGFVPGIVFNKTRQNLVYARTDIGGAYRWNPTTGRWIPLTDFISNAATTCSGWRASPPTRSTPTGCTPRSARTSEPHR
jgi:hypothetical protein